MGKLKQLASQTVVYGLSTIVGRILNYFLVPLYTRCFATEEYGVVVDMYTYVSFLMILLTYGMETGFFNFTKTENDPDRVFSTASASLFTTSAVFIILGILFSTQIAEALDYIGHADYVIYIILILGLDAFTSIPFARLRQQNKAMKFAIFKLINIFLQIGLNLFFILWLPKLADSYAFFQSIYNPEIGVGYVFIANLAASFINLLFFVPEYLRLKFKFDFDLLRRMLIYSLPLIISGLAGMINEFFDRLAIKFFYEVPADVADSTSYIRSILGIYGANTKIAVLMTLFIQCFRYAADPFFFSQKGTPGFNPMFSLVNKYLLVFGLFIFLAIMGYIDIIKHFISANYWEALNIVPLLLLGHLFVGLVYLQSFWYKLSNKTHYGIYIFVIGSVITILMDVLFVPVYGYIVCAWANVICYAVMLVITFLWGRKYLPCDYDFKGIALFSAMAAVCYIAMQFTDSLGLILKLSVNTLILCLFVYIVFKTEKLYEPAKKLINKLLKR